MAWEGIMIRLTPNQYNQNIHQDTHTYHWSYKCVSMWYTRVYLYYGHTIGSVSVCVCVCGYSRVVSRVIAPLNKVRLFRLFLVSRTHYLLMLRTRCLCLHCTHIAIDTGFVVLQMGPPNEVMSNAAAKPIFHSTDTSNKHILHILSVRQTTANSKN